MLRTSALTEPLGELLLLLLSLSHSFIWVIEKPSFPRMIQQRTTKGVTTPTRPETCRYGPGPRGGRKGVWGCSRLTSGRAPSRLLVCEMSCVSGVRGDFTLLRVYSSPSFLPSFRAVCSVVRYVLRIPAIPRSSKAGRQALGKTGDGINGQSSDRRHDSFWLAHHKSPP